MGLLFWSLEAFHLSMSMEISALKKAFWMEDGMSSSSIKNLIYFKFGITDFHDMGEMRIFSDNSLYGIKLIYQRVTTGKRSLSHLRKCLWVASACDKALLTSLIPLKLKSAVATTLCVILNACCFPVPNSVQQLAVIGLTVQPEAGRGHGFNYKAKLN